MKWNAHTHKANKACCCTVLQKWTSLLVHRSFQLSILHAIHYLSSQAAVLPSYWWEKWCCAFSFCPPFCFFSFLFCVAHERVSVLPDQNCCAVATSWENTHIACVVWKKKSTKFIVCFVFFVLIYGWRRRNVRNKNFRPTCKGCACQLFALPSGKVWDAQWWRMPSLQKKGFPLPNSEDDLPVNANR